MNKIAKDIIKEFGLEGLPAADQQAMIEQFSDVVMQAVFARALAALTEEQKDALNAVLAKDASNPDIIMDFFMTNIPNFDGLIQEEVARIRERAKIVSQK
jgi:hypothetical protein